MKLLPYSTRHLGKTEPCSQAMVTLTCAIDESRVSGLTPYYSSLIPVAMIHSDQKQQRRRKGLFGLCDRSLCTTGKCQDRNLGQEVQAEAIENTVSWFAYRFLSTCLSYCWEPPTLIRNSATQRSLGPIASTNNQNNLPQICPQASIIWAISHDSRQCH